MRLQWTLEFKKLTVLFHTNRFTQTVRNVGIRQTERERRKSVHINEVERVGKILGVQQLDDWYNVSLETAKKDPHCLTILERAMDPSITC